MLPHERSAVLVRRRGSALPGSDPVRTVVWVLGDHDIASRGHLVGTFIQAARLDDADVIVDLSGVTFMDASTIGAIVDAHNRLRALSRSLTIRGPSQRSRRLLDVCDLAFLIDEHPVPERTTEAAALRSWVDVPAADRAADTTHPPLTRQDVSPEPDRTTARRSVEPPRPVEQRRTSS